VAVTVKCCKRSQAVGIMIINNLRRSRSRCVGVITKLNVTLRKGSTFTFGVSYPLYYTIWDGSRTAPNSNK